jgi:hypothetical protein
MKRVVLTGMVLVVMAGAAMPAAGQSPTYSQAAMEGLAWLEGSWDRETRRGVTTERWSRLDDGNYRGDAIVAPPDGPDRTIERLQLVLRADEVIYIAEPVGQTRTEFTLTSWNETEFVFENPEHDFPTKIVYTRTGDGTMTATISGPDANGDTQEIDFNFTRRDG